MSRTAHFRVDPKLAHVLGENYSSSEKALKELIDNAWDAEATEVYAPRQFPDNHSFTHTPICHRHIF